MTAHATAVPLHSGITVNIREAKPEDADAMVRMVQALAEYQGIRARVSAKADDYRRDGFGPQRKFEAVIAEPNGQPVGMAMFQTFYKSWEGASALQITDLVVEEVAHGSTCFTVQLADDEVTAAGSQQRESELPFFRIQKLGESSDRLHDHHGIMHRPGHRGAEVLRRLSRRP